MKRAVVQYANTMLESRAKELHHNVVSVQLQPGSLQSMRPLQLLSMPSLHTIASASALLNTGLMQNEQRPQPFAASATQSQPFRMPSMLQQPAGSVNGSLSQSRPRAPQASLDGSPVPVLVRIPADGLSLFDEDLVERVDEVRTALGKQRKGSGKSLK